MSETDVLQTQVYVELARLNGLQEASILALNEANANIGNAGDNVIDAESARDVTVAAAAVVANDKIVVSNLKTDVVEAKAAVDLALQNLEADVQTVVDIQGTVTADAALAVEAKDLAIAARAGAELALSQFGDAEIFANQSEAARDIAEGYRDNSLVNANLAQAAADDVAANTAFQDLSAVDADIAGSSSDGYIYDTTLDSDGGAWRTRCQMASWYNEPLGTAERGTQRDFPIKCLVLPVGNDVVLYSLDFGEPEMWMVFKGHNFSKALGKVGSNYCVSMKNGLLGVGSPTYDLSLISFAGDKVWRVGAGGARGPRADERISSRNIVGAFVYDSSYPELLSRTITSISMIVEDNAPINTFTLLPQVVVAIGTAAGLSIVRDKEITHITHLGANFISDVHFRNDGALTYSIDGIASLSRFIHVRHKLPVQSILGQSYYYAKGSSDEFYTLRYNPAYVGATTLVSGEPAQNVQSLSDKAIGTNQQLTLLKPNPADHSKSLYSNITTDYNTGWLTGDVKCATLIDTDTGSISDASVVSNGDFSTNIDGWSLAGTGAATWENGGLRLTSDGAFTSVSQDVLTVGETYNISVEVLESGTSGWAMRVGTGLTKFTSAGTGVYTFTEVATTDGVFALRNFGATNTLFGSVTVTRLVSDRSYNSNDLSIMGTVTKTPVATGAELVGFEGFTASSRLEMDNVDDLVEFGVNGAVHLSAWIKSATTATQAIMGLNMVSSSQGGGTVFGLVSFGGKYAERSGLAGAGAGTPTSLIVGKWQKVDIVYDKISTSVYVDGQLIETRNATINLPEGSKLVVGSANDGSAPFQGSIALVKLSEYIPTPEVLLHMCEQERFMFQEGAQVTLHGSSNDVRAVAYDPIVDLDYVGTPAGLSIFQGLVRSNHDDEPVTTFIDAQTGTIVRQ